MNNLLNKNNKIHPVNTHKFMEHTVTLTHFLSPRILQNWYYWYHYFYIPRNIPYNKNFNYIKYVKLIIK